MRILTTPHPVLKYFLWSHWCSTGTLVVKLEKVSYIYNSSAYLILVKVCSFISRFEFNVGPIQLMHEHAGRTRMDTVFDPVEPVCCSQESFD
jgi:hypothetical protein